MSDMMKRLLLYLAIALAIAGVAYAVASILIKREPGAADSRAASPGKDAAPVPPRSPAEVATEATTAAGPGVRVVEVVGRVTRSSAGGERIAVAQGDDLAVDDTLVTEAASRVRLEMGARSTVDLAENAEVQVRELSESMQRLGLVYGRAAVDYREDGDRVLRIENQDGSAVAQVKAGKFSILNTGTTVAVATETGSVDLSAAGETTSVGANQRSVAMDGAPPRPLAIPAEIVLRVVDPGCRVQREAFFTVNGKTSPGSRVIVNDKAARVRGNGDFTLRIPLKVGLNKVVIVTEDVTGRAERRVLPCITVDPGASIEGVDIKWGTPSDHKGGG